MVGRWLNTNKMDASILHGSNSGDLGERYCSRYGWFPAAAKRILVQFTRDVNETLAYETETFGFWSETKTFLQFHETETSDFCHETETETLQGRDRDAFRGLQPSALCQNSEWRRSN